MTARTLVIFGSGAVTPWIAAVALTRLSRRLSDRRRAAA